MKIWLRCFYDYSKSPNNVFKSFKNSLFTDYLFNDFVCVCSFPRKFFRDRGIGISWKTIYDRQVD